MTQIRNKQAARQRKFQLKKPLVLNEGKPKGRQVTVADLVPYALQMHPLCGGKGIVRGTNNVPCKCATKRFFKAKPNVILDATGAAWWPAKEDTDGRTDSGREGATEGGPGKAGEGQG